MKSLTKFFIESVLIICIFLSSPSYAQKRFELASIVGGAQAKAYISNSATVTEADWATDMGSVSTASFLSANFEGDSLAAGLACVDFDDDYKANIWTHSESGSLHWAATIGGTTDNIFYILAADISGDQIDDLAAFYIPSDSIIGNNVYLRLAYGPNAQVQTNSSSDWLLPNERESAFISGKFSGDASNDIKHDIMAIRDVGEGVYEARIYKGENGTLHSSTPWTIDSEASSNSPLAFRSGDFNGDGWDDLASVFRTDSGTYFAKISLGPNGTSQHTWNLAQKPFIAFLTGDFDRDGYIDIAAIYDEDSSTRTAMIYHGSDSADASAQSVWSLESSGQSVVAYLSGDFEYDASTEDTDGDGIPDNIDPDDDNDGLSDEDEEEAGTDPQNGDTDNDGISDGQEIIDGTNPIDRGSYVELLDSTQCVEWNGYLGMWNIVEILNMSSRDLTIDATLYDLHGLVQGMQTLSLYLNQQVDVLVHEMQGFQQNSYGKICFEVRDGQDGDIDGRMVYYRLEEGSSISNYSFEFAFAMPFQNGIKDKQFVTFNTYQPSLNIFDQNNLVANWIQLTNLENYAGGGTLTYYSQTGEVLASEYIYLEASARIDLSAHRFGTRLVGLVEWSPDNTDSKFRFKNLRYFYDNLGHIDSFDSAFQVEGAVGSGELLSVTIDTRSGSSIIEMANTLNSYDTAELKTYNSNGTLVFERTYQLAPHESRHIVMNELLPNNYGITTIQGSSTSSIVAYVIQYERSADLGVENLYSVLARQSLSSDLVSSYNTFLKQDCELQIANPSAVDTVPLSISMTGSHGNQILIGEQVVLKPKSSSIIDVCEMAPKDTYGKISIQSQTTSPIVSNIIRIGNNENYRFQTPARQ